MENCKIYQKNEFQTFKCEKCIKDQPCVAVVFGVCDKPQICLYKDLNVTTPEWIEVFNIPFIIQNES